MAGLGGKNWSFQEEVTSSDVNGFLADQVVMRFADEATRTAGFGGSGEPVLAEGMVSYLDDANRVDVYTGAAWSPVSKVLQVVSTTKTDTFTTSSTSYTDVTGLTATITPSSTSSLILVCGFINTAYDQTATTAFFRLARGGTAIAIGDAEGSRDQGTASIVRGGGIHPTPFVFLDSPATSSATTYSCQVRVNVGQAVAMFVNRNIAVGDGNAGNVPRVVSNMTVMEISA